MNAAKHLKIIIVSSKIPMKLETLNNKTKIKNH